MSRGIACIADIRARCEVDQVTGCWHWQGAMNPSGPIVWTFDDRRGCKCSMTGARAVWQFLNRRQVPEGLFAYRSCLVHDCLAPSHVAAGEQVTIGRVVARLGIRKGTHLEQRKANAAKARAAHGIEETPTNVVLALRAIPASVSHAEAGRQLGVSRSVASDIRRGCTRASVWRVAA